MQVFVVQKRQYWLVTNILIWFICGCQSQVMNQCSQISEVANDTNQQLIHILQAEQFNDQDFKIGLQAVDIFNRAIAELKSLEIKDDELVKYQDELAGLWRVYAKITHEAIQAREIKSLSILTTASSQVQMTDKQMQQITEQINSYCSE